MYHESNKQIDVCYHFLREIISQGNIIVKKNNTSDNAAEMFTKSNPIFSKFQYYLDIIGVYII